MRVPCVWLRSGNPADVEVVSLECGIKQNEVRLHKLCLDDGLVKVVLAQLQFYCLWGK